MEGIALGFFVGFLVAIVSAIVWHSVVPRFVAAIAGATVTSVLVIQIGAYVRAGEFNTYSALIAAVSAMESIVVAALVGLVFKLRREMARRADAGQ